MYTIQSCPCCQSSDLSSYPAVVAPFIAHYAVGGRPSRCCLQECNACSFRFFDSRLTAEEVERLYRNYRGEEYFRSRHRDEFWYTRKFNTGIGHDQQAIAARKHRVETLLKGHLDLASIATVLDYGGDEGQFIPDALGQEKFVFELSDVTPVPGVTKIDSEADLRQRSFDMVMICHVLEHCSDPCALLKDIKALGGGRSLLCYIELPYERYNLRFAGRSKIFQWYLAALLRCSPALTAMDFFSTVVRLKTNFISPLGLMKCHEHLNFFNEKSLNAILQAAGFDVLECATARSASYLASDQVVYALAKARPD
jgi:hypothetical protein